MNEAIRREAWQAKAESDLGITRPVVNGPPVDWTPPQYWVDVARERLAAAGRLVVDADGREIVVSHFRVTQPVGTEGGCGEHATTADTDEAKYGPRADGAPKSSTPLVGGATVR